MIGPRLKWKVAFCVILISTCYALYDAFTVADIIAPTHPTIVSILVSISDLFIVFGAFCYAFNKVLIVRVEIWYMALVGFVCGNILVLVYEFVNVNDGYEIDNMISKSVIYIIIAGLYAAPTLNHINELKKTDFASPQASMDGGYLLPSRKKHDVDYCLIFVFSRFVAIAIAKVRQPYCVLFNCLS